MPKTATFIFFWIKWLIFIFRKILQLQTWLIAHFNQNTHVSISVSDKLYVSTTEMAKLAIFDFLGGIWLIFCLAHHVTPSCQIYTKISDDVSLINIMFVPQHEVICISGRPVENGNISQFCQKSKKHLFLCKIYRRFHF